MNETIYIETSILGYLTARPSRDLVVTANIEVTREWWEMRRSYFQLYSSQAVVRETSQGDAAIASQRLEIIRNLTLLELNQSVMDYLLTQNCKHIANAQIQKKLAEISLDFGYELPVLCTPYELLGG
jgi:hypothetical protein